MVHHPELLALFDKGWAALPPRYHWLTFETLERGPREGWECVVRRLDIDLTGVDWNEVHWMVADMINTCAEFYNSSPRYLESCRLDLPLRMN